jgi:hypothetical protein
MSKKDGGTAFPMQNSDAIHFYARAKQLEHEAGLDEDDESGEAVYLAARAEAIGGMTLLDYFAAKALQGFIASKDRPTQFHPTDDAAYCYALARAMLAERDQ